MGEGEDQYDASTWESEGGSFTLDTDTDESAGGGDEGGGDTSGGEGEHQEAVTPEGFVPAAEYQSLQERFAQYEPWLNQFDTIRNGFNDPVAFQQSVEQAREQQRHQERQQLFQQSFNEYAPLAEQYGLPEDWVRQQAARDAQMIERQRATETQLQQITQERQQAQRAQTLTQLKTEFPDMDADAVQAILSYGGDARKVAQTSHQRYTNAAQTARQQAAAAGNKRAAGAPATDTRGAAKPAGNGVMPKPGTKEFDQFVRNTR